MKRYAFPILVLAGVLSAGVAAEAQSPAPGGAMPLQGFSSSALVAQLSLYLPEESTRGMFGGAGGRGGGQSAGGQGAQGQGGAAGGGFRSQLAFTRDPKLYLTKDQIDRLLPILLALRENPMPTPSGAKKVKADVDGILTQGQKAEYDQFRKAVQDLIQGFRQRSAANGGGGPAGSGNMDTQRPGQEGAGSQMTTVQRRQRQLDAFIKVLQQRLPQADA
jgi:hypothetical protein